MKFVLPIASLIAIAMQIPALNLDTSIFWFFLVLWMVTGAALAFMILNARFRRKAKQAKMYAHLEQLIAASKGKFFSLSFTLPDGQRKVVNGKNFYYSLLSEGEPSRYKFVDRNRNTWTQLKRASNVRFICGKMNAMVGY